jgi:tRNA-2-methylthio-N6-dimethylallyladenosine synthase
VPEDVMRDRLAEIIELQKQHTYERNLEQVGKVEEVLVEKESKRSSDKWAGRTDGNKWVIFNRGNAQIKDMVPVEITEAKGISLHGKLLKAKAAA